MRDPVRHPMGRFMGRPLFGFVLHQEDPPPWKELSVGIALMEEQEVAVCALNIKTLHIFIFVFEH